MTRSWLLRFAGRLPALAFWGSCALLVSCVELTEHPPIDGKVWRAMPERLGDRGDAPEVAIDAEGNAVAIWTALDGIWSRRYPSDEGWSHPADQIDRMGVALSPAALAVDAIGNAVAVWSERDNVFSGRCVGDGIWGVSERLDDDRGRALEPQVAVSADGRAVAVWAQEVGSSEDVWSNRYSPAEGWQGPQQIATPTASLVRGVPQVAIDADGNAVVVWAELRLGFFRDIWSSRSATDGIWSVARPIDAGDEGDALNPQIGMDSEGNALAVWQQHNGERDEIWSNRYTADLGWGTAELIGNEQEGDAEDPHIAVRLDGGAVAVWACSGAEGRDIWSNRYHPDQGWGDSPEPIGVNRGAAFDPRVAVDPRGDAVAVWEQSAQTGSTIWSNRLTPQVGWLGSERIDHGNTGAARDPRVAMDRAGNAIAVWTVFQAEGPSVWSNRLSVAAR